MPMPHARTRRGSTLGQDRLHSIHEDRMIRTLMPRTFQASREALLSGSDISLFAAHPAITKVQ